MFPCYTKEKGEIQMTAEYKNWQEEFVDINFTDQRLKSRFFKIIDAFARKIYLGSYRLQKFCQSGIPFL